MSCLAEFQNSTIFDHDFGFHCSTFDKSLKIVRVVFAKSWLNDGLIKRDPNKLGTRKAHPSAVGVAEDTIYIQFRVGFQTQLMGTTKNIHTVSKKHSHDIRP